MGKLCSPNIAAQVDLFLGVLPAFLGVYCYKAQGKVMQSKAMLCQARISKAMPDEAYQSFANKGKPYDDNDETLFGVHAQVSFFDIFADFGVFFVSKLILEAILKGFD